MENITLVKLDKNDNQSIGILADLMLRRYRDLYTKLPSPTVRYYELYLRTKERPTHQMIFHIVFHNPTPIGFISIRKNKIRNRNQQHIDSYIIPSFRNRGIAKQVLGKLMSEIADDVDIITAKTTEESSDDIGPISSILKRIGANVVYTEEVNVSLFKKFDRKVVARTSEHLKANANSKGYSFHFITNGKHAKHPKINFDQFLRMVHEIWNDMPTEDASWEEEPISEEIYNAIFQNIGELDGQHWSLVAIHDATNEVVGLTDIYYYPDMPGQIRQGDTGVLRKHRGNRLGKTLKYIMLHKILNSEDLPFKPEYWITTNAGSNEHMLRINEELLYETWYRELYFELPLEAYKSWLFS